MQKIFFKSTDFTPLTKINSNLIIDLSVDCIISTLLKDKIRENPGDVVFGD